MPPFDSDTARAIVSAELGRPADGVLEGLDKGPVAAASLGQVWGEGRREGAGREQREKGGEREREREREREERERVGGTEGD